MGQKGIVKAKRRERFDPIVELEKSKISQILRGFSWIDGEEATDGAEARNIQTRFSKIATSGGAREKFQGNIKERRVEMETTAAVAATHINKWKPKTLR